jgi:hypothetical protein
VGRVAKGGAIVGSGTCRPLAQRPVDSSGGLAFRRAARPLRTALLKLPAMVTRSTLLAVPLRLRLRLLRVLRFALIVALGFEAELPVSRAYAHLFRAM